MKRTFFRLLLPALVATCVMSVKAELHIMVMTDMHVMDTTLFDTCALFRNYAQTEPKLVAQSAELFDTAVARVLEAHPDLLLIPGDMTKDGELVSHQYVTAALARLKTAGIRTLVVPGNHDINNPSAYSYRNGVRTRVPSITANEFATMYGPYGYNDAVMRQPGGLSYMAYVSSDLAVICLNSTLPNGASRASEGGLDEATLSWAEMASAQAHADGRYVIGMMHHQLEEHFLREAKVAVTYVANQSEGLPALADVHDRLAFADFGVMLTGHFHIHSIQRVETEDGDLYDVSTGALCSYASPLRRMQFANGYLTIATDTIGKYQAEAQEHNGNTVRGAISTISQQYYSQLIHVLDTTINDSVFVSNMNVPQSPAQLANDLNTYMYPALLPVLNALALGDEDQHNPIIPMTVCKAAFNNYWNYVVNGATSSNPIKTAATRIQLAVAKSAIDVLLDQELYSVLYNYMESEEDRVPDWAITIRLPGAPDTPTSTEVVRLPENSFLPGCYTIDGRLLPATNKADLPSGMYIIDGEKVVVR